MYTVILIIIILIKYNRYVIDNFKHLLLGKFRILTLINISRCLVKWNEIVVIITLTHY